jgi:hypothetical protein
MGSGLDIRITYAAPDKQSRSLRDWVNKYAKGLPPKVFNPAIKDATRRTIQKTRTRAVRRVAAETRVPSKVVRARTRNIKGQMFGARGIVLGLAFYARGISLPVLKARQQKKGVKAGKHFFPGAFLATSGLNSQEHGFKRKGAARYPLEVQKVQFKGVGGVGRIMRMYGGTYLPRRFLQQVKYRSDKLAKGAAGKGI